jgi:hypothetical protein
MKILRQVRELSSSSFQLQTFSFPNSTQNCKLFQFQFAAEKRKVFCQVIFLLFVIRKAIKWSWSKCCLLACTFFAKTTEKLFILLRTYASSWMKNLLSCGNMCRSFLNVQQSREINFPGNNVERNLRSKVSKFYKE